MIERAAFLPAPSRRAAAVDAPLPIGAGQTTSAPSLVKRMVAALELTPKDRVLEVGTGTGYAAAQLAQAAGEVYAVERVPELAARARETLKRLGLDNVTVIEGDGRGGLPAEAPFDAIMVSAAMPRIPPALLSQLAEDGRLIAPVGTLQGQRLTLVRRTGGQFQSRNLGPVRFLPLVRDRGSVMGATAAQDEYGARP